MSHFSGVLGLGLTKTSLQGCICRQSHTCGPCWHGRCSPCWPGRAAHRPHQPTQNRTGHRKDLLTTPCGIIHHYAWPEALGLNLIFCLSVCHLFKNPICSHTSGKFHQNSRVAHRPHRVSAKFNSSVNSNAQSRCRVTAKNSENGDTYQHPSGPENGAITIRMRHILSVPSSS